MKKALLTLAAVMIAGLSYAQSIRVINVFYDGKRQEFAVNTEKENRTTGFIRTKKIVLISERISICRKACLAEIKGDTYTSFSVIVAGNKIATVETNDPDNLLTNQAFSIVTNSGKEQLVLNLNTLENDNVAEVR